MASDDITLSDWRSKPELAKEFRRFLKNPLVQGAIDIWKEKFRCVHGGPNPTLVQGLDPIQSAAALSFFREGGNAAIDFFLSLAESPKTKPKTNDVNPQHWGDFRLQNSPPENHKV